jgi:hypothetical protein
MARKGRAPSLVKLEISTSDPKVRRSEDRDGFSRPPVQILLLPMYYVFSIRLHPLEWLKS